jgi:hypothetical protein
MNEKILFVNHDPGVLGGYRRLLHKELSRGARNDVKKSMRKEEHRG